MADLAKLTDAYTKSLAAAVAAIEKEVNKYAEKAKAAKTKADKKAMANLYKDIMTYLGKLQVAFKDLDKAPNLLNANMAKMKEMQGKIGNAISKNIPGIKAALLKEHEDFIKNLKEQGII